LVRERAGDEAVGEDDITLEHRGADALLHQLRAARHIEQHLAAQGHVVLGVEQDLTDGFADGCAARLADFADGDLVLVQEGHEVAVLRGLAAAVGTFEGEELAAEVGEPGWGRWDHGGG
jgi:hypothetical protein